MENSQMLHSYNSDTATAPSIGTDRLLRYLPKKQTEPRQVAIDIPETASQIVNQDASKEAGKLNQLYQGGQDFPDINLTPRKQ